MSRIETMIVVIMLSFVLIRVQVATFDMWTSSSGQYHVEFNLAYNTRIGGN